MDPGEALAKVLALPFPKKTQWVAPVMAFHRVCPCDLLTQFDLPPFDRATMDGFAVSGGTPGEKYPLAKASHAGGGLPPALLPGTAIPISTGAPVPNGTFAVLPVEKSKSDGIHVTFEIPLKAGAHIVFRGAEGKTGTTLMHAGDLWTPQAISAAVAAGHLKLPVWEKPVVGLLVTGDEVGLLGPSGVPDANGPLVASMLAGLGLDVVLARAADSEPDLAKAFDELKHCDVVLTTGGVSMGPRDLIPPMLQKMGAQLILHGIAQKPGKPMLVATLEGRRFFCLPGNPLSVNLCLHRYVMPHLRLCLGLNPKAQSVTGKIFEAVGPTGDRSEFLLLSETTGPGGDIQFHPHPAHSSGHLLALGKATAVWARPPGQPATPAGTTLTAEKLHTPPRTRP